MNNYRTHNCGELSKENIGKKVIISGWLNKKRDHGKLLFLDIRDNYGITQCVIDNDHKDFGVAEAIKLESVIKISGEVIKRSDDTINKNIKTGIIEIQVEDITILNESITLPFQVAQEDDAPEDIRLNFRYLDLRKERLKKNILLRSEVINFIRKRMIEQGFYDDSFRGILLTPNSEDLDLRNFEDLKKWFEINKPTIVILSAAKVGGIYANNNEPFDFILENLKIQTNIIELSWRFGVKRLLFLGSSCIYPKFAPQPIKEEYLMTGSLEKTNEFYALAKIAGIKLCQSLRIQHEFNSICLMPTNLYGPGDNYHELNSHVIPGLIRKFHSAKEDNLKFVKCWGTGSPLREFLHVDDLGEACLFALEKWDINNKNTFKDSKGDKLPFLNVGTGIDISIKNLANLVAKLISYEGKIIWDHSKPDGTPKKQLDVRRIN